MLKVYKEHKPHKEKKRKVPSACFVHMHGFFFALFVRTQPYGILHIPCSANGIKTRKSVPKKTVSALHSYVAKRFTLNYLGAAAPCMLALQR